MPRGANQRVTWNNGDISRKCHNQIVFIDFYGLYIIVITEWAGHIIFSLNSSDVPPYSASRIFYISSRSRTGRDRCVRLRFCWTLARLFGLRVFSRPDAYVLPNVKSNLKNLHSSILLTLLKK